MVVTSEKNRNTSIFWWGAVITLLLGFIYFHHVEPLTLTGYEDIYYFGNFSSYPIPRPADWNVTRQFSEYMMPLMGLVSAYLIYPLLGDYFLAANVILAMVMGLFLAALFFAYCRLYHALCENVNICFVAAVFTMLASFTVFKGNSELAGHMYISSFIATDMPNYNFTVAYVLPNILNSIIVLELLRMLALGKGLSIRNVVSLKGGLLLAAIYLGVFSILPAAGIILSFSLAVLFCHGFIHRGEAKKSHVPWRKTFPAYCISHLNIAVFIIGAMFVEMLLEMTSGRSQSASQMMPFGIDYLKRIWHSLRMLFAYGGRLHPLAAAIIVLMAAAGAVRFFTKGKPRAGKTTELVFACLASSLIMFVFHVLLTAMADPWYATRLEFTYGLFFFAILAVGLICLHLLREVPHSRLVIPLAVVVLFMVLVDMRGMARFRIPDGRMEFFRSLIAQVAEADEMGMDEVEIRVPRHSFPAGAEDYQGDNISGTFYNHRLTTRRIRINLVEEE